MQGLQDHQVYKRIQVGEIPADWKVDKLGKFIKVISGEYFAYNEFADTGIRVLKIDNVMYGKIDWENETFLPHEYMESHKELVLKGGDIVIALNRPITNNKVKVAQLSSKDAPSILYQRVGKVEFNEDCSIDHNFMYTFFCSDIFKMAISRLLIGSDQPYVKTSELLKQQVTFPSNINEQHKIASILSKVDELIQKTDQVIEQTQRLKKGLTQRLLTRGIGHTEFIHTEIGKIPYKWKIIKLHEISNKIVDGTHFTPTYLKDGIPFLRIVDIQSDIIDWDSVKKISPTEHAELTKRCKPEKGDVLLSKNGTVGITKVVNWDIPFSIFVSLCLIKPKHEIIDNSYLSYILSSDICLRQIQLRSKQGTVTNLHLEEIRELLIPVPPLLEQQEIISMLSSIQKKLKNENDVKHSHENLKKGLMQKLLTGKTRVKV